MHVGELTLRDQRFRFEIAVIDRENILPVGGVNDLIGFIGLDRGDRHIFYDLRRLGRHILTEKIKSGESPRPDIARQIPSDRRDRPEIVPRRNFRKSGRVELSHDQVTSRTDPYPVLRVAKQGPYRVVAD